MGLSWETQTLGTWLFRRACCHRWYVRSEEEEEEEEEEEQEGAQLFCVFSVIVPFVWASLYSSLGGGVDCQLLNAVMKQFVAPHSSILFFSVDNRSVISYRLHFQVGASHGSCYCCCSVDGWSMIAPPLWRWLEYWNNYLMDWLEDLHRHSWWPGDESQGPCWCQDFSFIARLRVDICGLEWNVSTSIPYIFYTCIYDFLHNQLKYKFIQMFWCLTKY